MKNRRTLLLLVALISMVSTISLWAQTEIGMASSSSEKKYSVYPYPAYLGFSVASHSGYGLSLQYRILQDIRIKTVLFAYFRDVENREESTYNVSMEVQHDILREGMRDIAYRFYALGGYRYYQSHSYSNYFTSSSYNNLSEEFQNNAFAGIGTEVLVFDRIAFGADFTFNYKNLRTFNIYSDNFTPTEVQRERVFSIGVGISGGIMF